jgi:putative phosphoesterase
MRVGLIADTHDRMPAVSALARQLAERGAEILLHAGDFCSPFLLDALHEVNLPLVGVFGRNDGDQNGLTAAAQRGLATELFVGPHSVVLEGSRILLVHDLGEAVDRSLEAHDIVVFGCQHRQELKTRGDAILVCPGEGCGWLYGTPGAAILDLPARQVEFLSLSGPEWAT